MHLRERLGNGPGGQLDLTPEQIDLAIQRSRQPGIALLRVPREHRLDGGTTGCRFGGNPTLPAEFDWPTYIAEGGVEMPMQFLLQVDLASVPRIDGLPPLPKSGTLFVFYDRILAPHVREGRHLKDGTACRVIYSDRVNADCAERSIPPIPDLEDFELEPHYSKETSFTRWAFDPVPVETYPVTGSALPDACEKRLQDIIGERDDQIATHLPDGVFKRHLKVSGLHTMFGASQRRYRPDAETCDLIGLDYDPDELLSDDHILLFSIAEDRHIHHEGLLGSGAGFWIKTTDLADLRFENVVVWADHYA